MLERNGNGNWENDLVASTKPFVKNKKSLNDWNWGDSVR